MPTTDSLDFEMQRRVVLYKSGTVMPDDTLLGFNGDPNSAGTTDPGERLIYNSPVGTLYVDDDGVMYRKTDTNNTWSEISSSSGGGSSTSTSDISSLAAVDTFHASDISSLAAASGGSTDLSPLNSDISSLAAVDTFHASDISSLAAASGGSTDLSPLNSDISSLASNIDSLELSSGGTSIATNNTQVSTDSSNNITFKNNGSNTWKIDSNGSLLPISGSEIGNPYNKLGNTFFDTANIWVGDNNKIIEENESKELGVMTLDRSVIPNIIQTILSEASEDFGTAIGAPNSILIPDDTTNEMYFSYASSKGYNLTIDDLYPPYGTEDYNADQWLVIPTKLRPLKSDIYGRPESITTNYSKSTSANESEQYTKIQLDLDSYNSFYFNASDNTPQDKLDIVHRSRSNPAELGYTYNVFIYREGGFDDFKIRARTWRSTDDIVEEKFFRTQVGNTSSEYCKLHVNTIKLPKPPNYHIIIDEDYFNSNPNQTIESSFSSEGLKLYGGGFNDYNLYNMYQSGTLSGYISSIVDGTITNSFIYRIMYSGNYNYTGLGFESGWQVGDQKTLYPGHSGNWDLNFSGADQDPFYQEVDSTFLYAITNNGIVSFNVYGQEVNGDIDSAELSALTTFNTGHAYELIWQRTQSHLHMFEEYLTGQDVTTDLTSWQ